MKSDLGKVIELLLRENAADGDLRLTIEGKIRPTKDLPTGQIVFDDCKIVHVAEDGLADK